VSSVYKVPLKGDGFTKSPASQSVIMRKIADKLWVRVEVEEYLRWSEAAGHVLYVIEKEVNVSECK
jgi:hypothetical protein